MLSLKENIIEEAKKLGWTGVAEHYENEEEVLTDVFMSKEDYDNKVDDFETFGNCIRLIEYLENHINLK